MMDWLANEGNVLVMVVFFATFLAFALWAYKPANKSRMKDYGSIPLRENRDGE